MTRTRTIAANAALVLSVGAVLLLHPAAPPTAPSSTVFEVGQDHVVRVDALDYQVLTSDMVVHHCDTLGQCRELAWADVTRSMPPCLTEDQTSSACYWDAQARGNRAGRSFWVDVWGSVFDR